MPPEIWPQLKCKENFFFLISTVLWTFWTQVFSKGFPRITLIGVSSASHAEFRTNVYERYLSTVSPLSHLTDKDPRLRDVKWLAKVTEEEGGARIWVHVFGLKVNQWTPNLCISFLYSNEWGCFSFNFHGWSLKSTNLLYLPQDGPWKTSKELSCLPLHPTRAFPFHRQAKHSHSL